MFTTFVIVENALQVQCVELDAGLQIRVQHLGDDQLILVTLRYWGDDFKISCLGEFLRNLGKRNYFLDLGMVVVRKTKILHLRYPLSVFNMRV